MTLDLVVAVARARDLIAFCDGIGEGGFPEYARRSRVVARDLIELADALAASRSVADAMAKQRDEVRELLARRASLPNPFLTEATDIPFGNDTHDTEPPAA